MQSSMTGPRGQAARIVEEHYRPLWRYLRFLGCSDALAEDLAQETFVAILDRPPVLDEPDALSAYLRSIARNLFLKSLRQARSEPAWADLREAESVWKQVAGDGEWETYLEALKGCIQGLEERDRGFLEGYYGRDSGRKEAAASFGMSEEGLKSLIRRIKDRLKACVKGKLSHE